MSAQPSTRQPRVPSGRTRRNAEKWSWVFMRVTGPVLLVLILTHLFINLMTGDGISQIDFAFVAGKWASPLWQWWDLLMLVLALLHGGNGMRLLINDYAHHAWLRKVLHSALGVAVIGIIVLGSLVIFTFDACPVDADPSLLPSFCEDVR
ncbi:succinate dehydrogenase hydrophobic membrane anchor subunit [Demequina sp. SYSU T00192]|uniref:Succinate dehydrogenase hydrophobic membrane anchor subunit n=1 Tax=Demequina litoralis TaxID=3051660 RepID=A0ABT8GBR7_9MICO|nr:succinate dehydrogenase hydrophobic membrane anchor subunit [Demequina sp. SYSU T00192]MDN4476578.1 succinate dehydrogenase hydrophobic membrane anchor subunit [Demequina sp. SYSU T00192]